MTIQWPHQSFTLLESRISRTSEPEDTCMLTRRSLYTVLSHRVNHSLLNALRHKEIGEYWYGTGTPTFLVRALRNSDAYIPEILHDEADSTELARIDSYRDSAIGILFQTGYLTIKGYNPQRETYNLGLPNREVASGFFKDLLPQYMDIGLKRKLET